MFLEKVNIDYETLTKDELEEYVEFIEWDKVPSHLIDDKIIEKFPFINYLRRIVWFKKLYEKFEKREIDLYPDRIFYFIGDDWYMDLDLNSRYLSYSVERIWANFKKDHSCSFDGNMELLSGVDEVQLFMRNFMQNEFKKVKIIPNKVHDNIIYKRIEENFKKVNS